MQISINIPKDVKYIINRLHSNGYKAYIVGGCVRDSILGRIPKDWDIATSAKPEDILSLFTDTIPTGLKHGTITVVMNTNRYEVTTFRIDGQYEDSRHPNNVEFIDDIIQDLSRRDFTINSMAYSESEGLIDPFDGIDDLKDERISCVGYPDDRFQEDALRMMRAVRFSAQLGFKISDSIRFMIKWGAYESLHNVSIERIRDEFNKILLADCPSTYIKDLMQMSLTRIFIPEIHKMEKFPQNNHYHNLELLDHALLAVDIIEAELHLRLAMLLHDIGKPKTETVDEDGISHYYNHPELSVEMASEILHRMKYDNTTIDKTLMLIGHHDCTIGGKSSIKRLLKKMGEDLFRDLLKVKWSDTLAQNPLYAQERLRNLVRVEKTLNEILEEDECFSIRDLAIHGKDLIEIGFKQGKQIGFILNDLLNKVIEDNSLNTKEQLINIIRKSY